MSIFRAPCFISFALLAIICGWIPWTQAATVSQITLDDFVNPRVLNFENVSDSLIGSTANLFTDFGLQSVFASFSFDVSDMYDFGTSSGRALFEGSFGDLILVSPGNLQPQFALNTTWLLAFSQRHSRFGVSFADLILTDITLTFSNAREPIGSITVGSITFSYSAGSGEIFYFETTELFNRVAISISSDTNDGYGIDNLTLDPLLIPAPSGLFDSHQSFTTDPSPVALTVANLDGKDGVDLAVSSGTEAKITALLNNGNGTFLGQDIMCGANVCETGNSPLSITSADFNRDGRPDLATANQENDDVTILLNQGQLSFTSQTVNLVFATSPDGCGTACKEPTAITTVGRDLAVAIASIDEGPSRVVMLDNNGRGSFMLGEELLLDESFDEPTAITAADFDGDGDLDHALTIENTVTVLKTQTPLGIVGIPVGLFPQDILAAKLNADRHLDLAVVNEGHNTMSILLNNGNGSFTTLPPVQVGDSPRALAAADLDGDGDLDLAVANYGEDTVSILENNGNGVFTELGREPVGKKPRAIAAAQLDSNCSPDLAVVNEGDSTTDGNVSVLLNIAPANAIACNPGLTCNGLLATITRDDAGNIIDNSANMITGTPEDDVIAGLGGNDVIAGGGGHDTLCGGAGRDEILGGPGNDTLFGDAGADTLLGGSGRDQLFGETGNDILRGGSGADDLRGGKGRDRLLGGSGNDTLRGNSGNDRLQGQGGSDMLLGGPGDDKLHGGSGNDTCNGQSQNTTDTVIGRTCETVLGVP